jgi:hypothetical protein
LPQPLDTLFDRGLHGKRLPEPAETAAGGTK